eukprot:TRINITY_DN10619_c0_g2_i1.p1 TRINITY_DN10619_c0_g2~~TRINITY_DN10619_c0_g2_i1.p1  ORF type:complete len:252 (-),score=39.43 TRINITY_DN10619_c0_g2_i1:161-916(-)
MNLVNFTARNDENKAFLSLANNLHQKILSNKGKHGLRQVLPLQKENRLSQTQGIQLCREAPFESELKLPASGLRTIEASEQSLIFPDETNPSASKVKRLLAKQHSKFKENKYLLTCKIEGNLKVLHDTHLVSSNFKNLGVMKKLHSSNIGSSEVLTAEGSQRTLQKTLRNVCSDYKKFDTKLLRIEKTKPMDKIAECEQYENEEAVELEETKRRMQALCKEELFLFPVFSLGKGFSAAKFAISGIKYLEIA